MHVKAHGGRRTALGEFLGRDGVAEQASPPPTEFGRYRQPEKPRVPEGFIILDGC
jgi:hypothetical protein